MIQSDRPGLVQLSVARAGLFLAMAPLLAMHNTSEVQRGKAPIILLLSSHSQLEAGNLNWLSKFFFHSALREIEFDLLLLEQVRLGGFVCLFGEKALKLSCRLSSLPACAPTVEAGSGTHAQDRAVP